MNIINVHRALYLLYQDWTRTHRILSLGKMWRSFTDWGKLLTPDTWTAIQSNWKSWTLLWDWEWSSCLIAYWAYMMVTWLWLLIFFFFFWKSPKIQSADPRNMKLNWCGPMVVASQAYAITTHATQWLIYCCRLGYQPHAFVLSKKSYNFSREGSLRPCTDDFHHH